MALVPEMQQRIQVRISNCNNITTATTVTTVGSAFRNILFAVEANASSSTVSCFYINTNEIDEVHRYLANECN
jgi:hypothetical protein